MDLSKLNREQLIAAETLEGPVLILAGAGSGKTRALTYRVANLIDHGIPAWRILALTFTNKAAKEMKNRVADLIGAEAADDKRFRRNDRCREGSIICVSCMKRKKYCLLCSG